MGLHGRAIVLIPLTTIETKGNPIKQADALLKAQEILIEAIKAGALPKFGMDDAKALSKFISNAHKELMDYYSKIEL